MNVHFVVYGGLTRVASRYLVRSGFKPYSGQFTAWTTGSAVVVVSRTQGSGQDLSSGRFRIR